MMKKQWKINRLTTSIPAIVLADEPSSSGSFSVVGSCVCAKFDD